MATCDTRGSSRYVEGFRTFVSETWLGYPLVLPAVVMLGVIIVYPTLRGIQLAFFEASLLNPEGMASVGLANFAQMAGDATSHAALWHTVLLTAVAVSLQYVPGPGLALALKEMVPGAGVFRSLSMISWLLPVIVMAIVCRFLVQPGFGPVNILLAKLGLETTYWFGRPGVAFPLIVIMHVWRNVPFYAIALMAAMKSIPDTQYEAARLDGAGPLQTFRYITLPQISYVSMVMIVHHVIYTFNNFDVVSLSTGGGPLGNTEVMATYVYEQAFRQYALGYGTSMALVMLIIMMGFSDARGPSRATGPSPEPTRRTGRRKHARHPFGGPQTLRGPLGGARGPPSNDEESRRDAPGRLTAPTVNGRFRGRSRPRTRRTVPWAAGSPGGGRWRGRRRTGSNVTDSFAGRGRRRRAGPRSRSRSSGRRSRRRRRRVTAGGSGSRARSTSADAPGRGRPARSLPRRAATRTRYSPRAVSSREADFAQSTGP